jgi:cleavage and polyadenylation specificity factor subunit 1
MILFGKTKTRLEVITAEFLSWGKQLHIVIFDADSNMHVHQFDPERTYCYFHFHQHIFLSFFFSPISFTSPTIKPSKLEQVIVFSLLMQEPDPKSLSGQRLLHKSTFHTGHCPSSTLLLPSTLAASAIDPSTDSTVDQHPDTTASRQASPFQHMLITLQTGALAILTPLTEPTYRRLSALQTHLQNILDQPAGLNPRAYRNVESEISYGGRGVLDGGLLLRWTALDSQRKREAAGKVGLKGEEVWVLRSDLEIIAGVGLGYL